VITTAAAMLRLAVGGLIFRRRPARQSSGGAGQ
jgi:hypothetical protein